MSSEVSHQSNKRSISSTIASFFKKDSPVDYHSTDDIKPSSITADFEGVDTTDLPSVPELLLFESKNGTRPFLLPIMPLERLKILRQKQYLRHLQDSQLGQVTAGFNPNTTTKLAENQLIPLRSLKRRSLNAVERSKHSLRKPKFAKETSLGKRWNADFEYDLSEYDTVKRPKIAASVGIDDPTSSLESPRLSPSVLKRGTMGGKRTMSNGLTKTEENILNGKSLTDLTSTSVSDAKTLPQCKGPQTSTTKPLLALPSSGFDFVKPQESGDAKGKDSLKSDDRKPKVQISLDQKPDSDSAKKPFSFKRTSPIEGGINPAESNGVKNPSSSLFSFGAKNDKQSSTTVENENETKKPISFNFGNTTNDQKQNNPKAAFNLNPALPGKLFNRTEPSPDHKEISSTDEILPPPKNSFTFRSAANKSEANVNAATVPKASDSTASKPAFTFGTEQTAKPTFDFGSKSSSTTLKGPEPESELTSRSAANLLSTTGASKSGDAQDGKKVPSFTFGSTRNTEDLGKEKSFTFGGEEKSGGSNTGKPSTGFTFGVPKPPVDSSKPAAFSGFGVGNKSESAPPESTSTAQKPLFSLKTSSEEHNETNQNPAAGSSSSIPAIEPKKFSFGPTTGEDKSATPFSFGSNAESKPPTPSFSFGSGTQANAGPSSTGGIGFKFDTSGFKQSANQNDQSKNSLPVGSSLGAAKPSFSFGSNSSSVAAPQPQQNTSTLVQPPQNNGFNFGSGSSTSNNSPAFGASANNQQMGFNFGAGNTTASSTPPPFGASNPSLTAMNPQSRPFSPSNTINMNFGGVASQPPSSIFGGAAGTPAQAFGGQALGTTGSFGGGGVNQNPLQVFGGQNVGDVSQQQGQTPMLNLPPGRKLARMRARRN